MLLDFDRKPPEEPNIFKEIQVGECFSIPGSNNSRLYFIRVHTTFDREYNAVNLSNGYPYQWASTAPCTKENLKVIRD